jgi:dihydrofolate reductase
MKAIFSMNKNMAIGDSNQKFGLIHHSKEDLKHFKETTEGGIVIMGSSTYESLPSLLPNRRNIILTNRKSNFPNVETVSSLSELKELLGDSIDSAWVIGGSKTIQYFMDEITEWVITIWDFHSSNEDGNFTHVNFLEEHLKSLKKEYTGKAFDQDSYQGYVYKFI